jgi:hypothetical protein
MCENLIGHCHWDILGLCTGENEFFKSFIIDVEDGNQKNNLYITIVVFRLDTFEAYSYFYIEAVNKNKKDKEEWYIKTLEYLKQLGRPVDWQKPHRYCIARHAFIILRNEKFKIDLEKNKLNSNDIYRYTLISQFKEAALIKKLNRLSDEEKIQLFTLKDWEIKLKDKELSNYSRKDILFNIHRRTYLYKRLLDKEKFKQYYIEYNKKIDQLYGEN